MAVKQHDPFQGLRHSRCPALRILGRHRVLHPSRDAHLVAESIAFELLWGLHGHPSGGHALDPDTGAIDARLSNLLQTWKTISKLGISGLRPLFLRYFKDFKGGECQRVLTKVLSGVMQAYAS